MDMFHLKLHHLGVTEQIPHVFALGLEMANSVNRTDEFNSLAQNIVCT